MNKLRKMFKNEFDVNNINVTTKPINEVTSEDLSNKYKII